MPSEVPSTYEMAYAVHTGTCTYLLDEYGVCRWIVSRQGVVPNHVRQCIGAQFVACLDLGVEGGLVGDLKQGGMALFVRRVEPDRMVLLRTGKIMHVDDRRVGDDEPMSADPQRVVIPQSKIEQYGRRQTDSMSATPRFGVVRYTGEEQTITITLPTVDAVTERKPRL